VFLKETQNPMEVQSLRIPWRMMSAFWMNTDSSLAEVFILEEEVDQGVAVQGAVAVAVAVAVARARARIRARARAVVEAEAEVGAGAVSI
jgi:hypothetical protein